MPVTATASERPVKVLLTKSFIDSHDRAIKTIAVALREAVAATQAGRTAILNVVLER